MHRRRRWCRNREVQARRRSPARWTSARPDSWRRRRPCRTTAPNNRPGCAKRPQPMPPRRSPRDDRSSIHCDPRAGRSPCRGSTIRVPGARRDRSPHPQRVQSPRRRCLRRHRDHRRRVGNAACGVGRPLGARPGHVGRGRGTADPRGDGRGRAASGRSLPSGRRAVRACRPGLPPGPTRRHSRRVRRHRARCRRSSAAVPATDATSSCDEPW